MLQLYPQDHFSLPHKAVYAFHIQPLEDLVHFQLRDCTVFDPKSVITDLETTYTGIVGNINK